MPEPERGAARDVVIAGAGSAGELLFDCILGDPSWNAVVPFPSVRDARLTALREAATRPIARSAQRP